MGERPRVILMGGHDIWDCPTCGSMYEIAFGPGRVELRVRCNCPDGAPAGVLANARAVSEGGVPFPTQLDPAEGEGA